MIISLSIYRQQRFAPRKFLCKDTAGGKLGVASAVSEIELRNVSLSFDRVNILENLNLQIAKGERFVIVGPSGQGKSVALKLMAGLLSPTSGEVLIDGQDLSTLPPAERTAARRRMGMLFQKNALFDSLTCEENVAFPLRETTNLTENEILKKSREFLEAVGLGESAQLFPDEISGGMQKRLGIARALALDPQIIYYDDPTAGLDPITSRKIVTLIMDLQKKNGSTLIAITNDMNRAFQLGDRMGMVVNGELIITGTPEQTKKFKDPRVQQFIHGALEGPLTETGSPA